MILALWLSAPSAALPAGTGTRQPGYWIDGPVQAEVIRVIDGDTVEVRAFPWPQQSVTVKVRLRGIDAPEMHSKCALEKEQGHAAREALQKIIDDIGSISLTDISGGKYFGRVLANLELDGGYDASTLLLNAGLVRAYNGGTRVKTTCR